MARLSRRNFLKRTLAAAATITIAGTKSSGASSGPTSAIRVGVAGLNGRGGAHVGAYVGMKDVQIAYLIDPDTRTYAKHLKNIEAKAGNKPQTVQDVRKALEDKNLDAISIATPNHWHALMTIWACQAGKDVYVEKPCSHNVHEGRIAVEMARKYNRIVQHGTQSRSGSTGRAHSRIRQVRQARQAAGLPRSVLQAARQHRHQEGQRRRPRKSISTSGSGRRRAALQRQPGALQLALVLGFRQRRHRQPGRA